MEGLSKPTPLKPIFDITKGGCFCRAIFILRIVWLWINVRYIPVRLTDLWECSTDSLERTEELLDNFKVDTLSKWAERNIFHLTQLPNLCIFL